MDKTLFKEYEEWCVKNDKDPLNEETVREFKLFKEKEEQEKVAHSKVEKKAELVEKQKEIFKLMTEYVGVKVKYDDDEDRDFFEVFDALMKAVVGSVAIAHKNDELDKVMDTILGQKGERI